MLRCLAASLFAIVSTVRLNATHPLTVEALVFRRRIRTQLLGSTPQNLPYAI